jgi:hypothetical protein
MSLCQDWDEQRQECTRVACCAFLLFLFINNRKKPFCFFVASLLILSLPFARSFASVCMCVCPLFYFLLQETRERDTGSKHCLLARSRAFTASLSTHYHHHTSRLLLTIVIIIIIIHVFSFIFKLDFFLIQIIMSILYLVY